MLFVLDIILSGVGLILFHNSKLPHRAHDQTTLFSKIYQLCHNCGITAMSALVTDSGAQLAHKAGAQCQDI